MPLTWLRKVMTRAFAPPSALESPLPGESIPVPTAFGLGSILGGSGTTSVQISFLKTWWKFR